MTAAMPGWRRRFSWRYPIELTDEQRRALVSEFVHKLVEKHGVAADVGYPQAHHHRNIHATFWLSHRQLGPEGFGEIANTRIVTRKRNGKQEQEKVAGIAATPADIQYHPGAGMGTRCQPRL